MMFPFPTAAIYDMTTFIAILRPIMMLYAPTITIISAILSFPFLLLHFAGAEPKPNSKLLLHIGSIALGLAFACLSAQNLLTIAEDQTTYARIGVSVAALGAILIAGMYLLDIKLRKAKANKPAKTKRK